MRYLTVILMMLVSLSNSIASPKLTTSSLPEDGDSTNPYLLAVYKLIVQNLKSPNATRDFDGTMVIFLRSTKGC